jgi:hypothetical protein
MMISPEALVRKGDQLPTPLDTMGVSVAARIVA